MRVMIFGTIYVDTPERLKLTHQWCKLHRALNPDCDLLLVDSCSPMIWRGPWEAFPEAIEPINEAKVGLVSFDDNIGHLSHGGRDGWGRAFCKGLASAMEHKYDYVAHIEGDSLFRLPVLTIVQEIKARAISVASAPIGYGDHQRSTWVETGLMFFDVDYLRESNFIAGYDWPNRQPRPQPEVVIRRMLGSALTMMPWNAERSDKNEINTGNVSTYDWVTHVSDPAAYDRFVEDALGLKAAA
jgi:hypothetical protein